MQVHIFKSGIDVHSGMVQGLSDVEFTIKLASDVEKAYESGYTYAEIWAGIDEYGNKVEVDEKRVAEAQVIAPTYDTLVTDEGGNCYSVELPYGKFIGKETRTPKDFETASDFYFSITQDESEIEDIAKKVKDIVINNEQLETYIKLIKKDKATGKIVSASSATFKIKAMEDIYDRGNNKILYKKGEVINQKIGSTTYDTFTTNSENLIIPANSYANKNDDIGSVTTPLKLEVGKFQIYEILEPTGFLILQEPIEFKVEGIRDYDQDQDGDYIKTIEIFNEQPTATIIVDKNILLRDNVDTSLIDTSDYSKIQFKLTAKEDIIDKADNSVIYKAGAEIGIYNLSKEGTLKIEGLPLGIYDLQECSTLSGLVLDDTIYTVEFKQKDNTTKVYTETLEIDNETTIFEFSKTDITGQKELVGAELAVIDESNNVIDSWTSAEETHKIEGLEAGKTYTLIERIAVKGYVKATEIKFTVNNSSEIQKVTMIDKIVEILKVDNEGNPVENVTLQVLDEENNVADEWVTTKEAHKVSNLEENKKYILVEKIVAEGYVKATNIEFTVTDDKATQKIEMIDKIVEVLKVDNEGNPIENVTLQVLDKDENVVDEWITTKLSHRVSNLEENKSYILREKVVVDGFVKATDIEFTVTDDKATQKIEMIDKIVEVLKVDNEGNPIENVTLQVLDENENVMDEWTTTKEAHKVSNLEENKSYILREKIAVEGYVKATDIEFTVTADKETQKIVMIDKRVLISKVDLVTGEELEGATLKVLDEQDNIIDEWISSKEPHYVSNLEENKTYKLVEEIAPYGYLITETIEFTVTGDKETQKIVMKDMPILTTLKLTKIDEDTKEIIKDKFTFGLYVDEECTQLIQQVDSNKKEGTITFEDIRYGTFYIKELSAPKNYILSEKVLKLEINDKGVFIDNVEIQESDSIYNFEFSNKKIETPKTSDESNDILWLIILIISTTILFVIVIYEKIKSRKRK